MHLNYLFLLRKINEIEIFPEPKPSTGEFTFIDKVREKNKGWKSVEDVDHSSESSDESIKVFIDVFSK